MQKKISRRNILNSEERSEIFVKKSVNADQGTIYLERTWVLWDKKWNVAGVKWNVHDDSEWLGNNWFSSLIPRFTKLETYCVDSSRGRVWMNQSHRSNVLETVRENNSGSRQTTSTVCRCTSQNNKSDQCVAYFRGACLLGLKFLNLESQSSPKVK